MKNTTMDGHAHNWVAIPTKTEDSKINPGVKVSNSGYQCSLCGEIMYNIKPK